MEMELFSFSFLIFAFIILSSGLLFFFRRPSPGSISPAKPNAIKSYPLVGYVPHLIMNSHRILDWSTELLLQHPSSITAGNATIIVAPLVFTTDPAVVEHVSKTRFDNYPKCDSIISSIRDCLGRGIPNVNGEEWRLQRKAAVVEFNARSLRSFLLDGVRRELADRLLPLLAEFSRSGDIVDLQDLLERFAFDSICTLVIDDDPKCLGASGGGKEEGERFFSAFHEATRLSVERAKQPHPLVWKIKKWLNVPSERRLRESMAIVHAYIDRCINLKRKQSSTTGGHDFLSRFAAEGFYSDEYIRDTLIGFVLAGSDTTPAALTWFFWILSSRPDIVKKILQEIDHIRSRRRETDNEEQTFNMEELREMNYLQAALSETLRLYPLVPLVPRDCLADDELPDGTPVRKGWTVMYNAYAMGRTEAIWGPDCREFRPERWLEDNERRQTRSSFAFPAFHSGPRACMGRDMAYVQMKAVAASVLERFEVAAAADRGRPELLMAMRMEGGLPVRMIERRR